jgi:hypothetical protein
MIRDGDLWVHQGKIEQPINWQTIIDDAREERIQAIIGMGLLDNSGEERKAKSERRRAKGEERKAKSERRRAKGEERKAKSE